MTNNNNNNLNQSASKLSFIFRRNYVEIKKINNNYSSVSRNKKNKTNFKRNNLLSISFSLKDFRNNIINAFSQSNIYEIKNNHKNSNIINLKNNTSLLNIDNISNIEETRNTTSITGFHNSNLLYNKHLNYKEKKKGKEREIQKSTKFIKINCKQNKQFFSPKNSSKIITFTKNNDIIKEKQNYKYSNSNLHSYIYKNNNIKNKNNKTNNLILIKKTFKNNRKDIDNNKKVSLFNPICELDNDNNINCLESERIRKKLNKNICFSIVNNCKKEKIKEQNNNKYKKRKTKSQESNYKIGVNNELNKEFKSVEEIHFTFVQIYQKKKEFFRKNNIEVQ